MLKEDNRRFVIDEEVAPVVRDIFKWKSEGVGDTIIARRLNEMGIPCPMKRRVDNKDVQKSGNCRLYLWRDRTIRIITTNPVYLGHMTQGKTKQALCDNMPMRLQPSSEWIIVENTHTPIVDIETYNKAQQARSDNTKDFYKNYDKSKHMSGENHLFKKLLVCAQCGSRLIRCKTSAGSDKHSFFCPVKRKNLGTDCTHKTISEAYLYDGVLAAIQSQVKAAVNLSALVDKLNKQRKNDNPENDITKRMAELQKELKRLTNLKSSLYESYADKLLTESEYIYSKQRYSKQIDEIKQRLEYLQEESVTNSETLTPKNKWLQAFKRFTDHNELSCDMVHTLIKQITISGNNEFEITWNFKNEYEALCEYAGEVSA
jgi:hypothetical protein